MNKKNIGILTLPLKSNYGGLLQAYALQQVLLTMGHKVLTIDRVHKEHSLLRKGLSFIKQFLISVYKKKPMVYPHWRRISHSEEKIISQNTNRFKRDNIKITERINSTQKLSLLKKYDFNTFIVGSDQVWRPGYSPYIANHFLDFVENAEGIRRIAYSASFGLDKWIFSPTQTSRCASLIKKFDAISVREDSGVELCKEKFDVDALMVLDPTLLLTKEDYMELGTKNVYNELEGNLMTYILDQSPKNKRIVRKVSNKLGLATFSIMPNTNLKGMTKKNIKDYIYPPVEKWIMGFNKADFVVTDSFHGTIFAIIFNKPFLTIGNKKRGLSRFNSILGILGLRNRLLVSSEEVTSEMLFDKIDYAAINKKLEIQREKSINFLKRAI